MPDLLSDATDTPPPRTQCCRCSARPAVYLIRPHELGLCRPCYLWIIHGEYAYEQPEPVPDSMTTV